MSHLRDLGLRIPAIGGLIGITGLVGFLRQRRRPTRPTGKQLAAMSDRDFASFIQGSGIKTVTTAGLAPMDGSAD
jgi:hypothetical protein